MDASFVGLIVLVLLVAAIIAGIVGLIMLVRSGSGAGGTKVCGKCNYSVTGLTTFDCPECGSDLREVGIIQQGGGNRGLAIVLVVIGALALVCTCGSVVMSVLAFGSNTTVTPMPMPPAAVQGTIAEPEEDVDPEPVENSHDEELDGL